MERLTDVERFIVAWLLITPRYHTIAEKLNAAKLKSHANQTNVGHWVGQIYSKLGITSRYELLTMADELNVKPVKEAYDSARKALA